VNVEYLLSLPAKTTVTYLAFPTLREYNYGRLFSCCSFSKCDGRGFSHSYLTLGALGEVSNGSQCVQMSHAPLREAEACMCMYVCMFGRRGESWAVEVVIILRVKSHSLPTTAQTELSYSTSQRDSSDRLDVCGWVFEIWLVFWDFWVVLLGVVFFAVRDFLWTVVVTEASEVWR
jgi:hypothetical protein